ncbi:MULTISPECIES: hypothetical protein [unclassified Aureimonas]|uniref:hypothetical protein n=1 Tax=unclassified Aureimonas TaxID=2615206 RepID=UPI0007010E15|nr:MULTISPECIES: hypothetical protein [unclassified Aureimonas]KQT69785.1 hypothetical protein ASG62_01340 [Aureimonas sp. Leaf427]KQT76063.1 hypothetical protein ASG54_14880 [Aureimonas sp. Leaf460]
MRNLRETTKGATAGAASILTLAVSLLALSVPQAGAEEAKGGSGCSQRYHASLGEIAKTEYPALKAATRMPGTVQAGDPGLPGNLLFPPLSVGQRTREETAALRFAASLARAKGRTGGTSDADAAWMADRLRTALGDYLTQSPSPYLCSGVEDYIAELRGDARRLGPPPIQREALIAAQTSVVQRAVSAALLAMKPVPLPADKPADRPAGGALSELRPTMGPDRVDMTISTGSTSNTPRQDPDLPERAPEVPQRFDTAADLTGAVDRLTAAATAGGFLAASPLPAPAGPMPAISPATYPVLARLAEVRPVVTGTRPAVTDRTVRLRLATALSAIETLDYLMRSRTEVVDPVAAAMDATFGAILKAHEADCTCRN